MAISFSCPTCDKQFRVPDDMAGKKGRCKNCGDSIIVPSTGPQPPTLDTPAYAVAAEPVEVPPPVQQTVASPPDLPLARPASAQHQAHPSVASGAPPYQPRTQAVIAISQKSVGIAILLTILFGPLGMLYSTIVGAIIMIVLSVFLALVTLGFSILITWPVSIVWAAVAAHLYNRRLLRGAA